MPKPLPCFQQEFSPRIFDAIPREAKFLPDGRLNFGKTFLVNFDNNNKEIKMNFYSLQEKSVFENLCKSMRKNGSIWRRNKDHLPVMHLYKRVGKKEIDILLDAMIPSDRQHAYGMIFEEGTIAKQICVNLKDYLFNYGFRVDLQFRSSFKMSDHLGFSCQAFRYIKTLDEFLQYHSQKIKTYRHCVGAI